MPTIKRLTTYPVWMCLLGAGLFGCGSGQPEPVPEPAAPDNPRLAVGVDTLPGFQAEVLYTVPGEQQGSWVSLCNGPDGTLFASAQSGGVFQISPPAVWDFDAEAVVTPVPVEVGNAHGLCWAFDSLYVMASGSGMHRVTDTDADGVLDTAQLILPLEGSGEHGPHAIIEHPDGESLLIVCGNHTALPPLTSSRVPQVWDEDLLLPREWDARGHAAGVMAPGGYVCRVSPDASEVELVSIGYRNAYDLALNPAGELFTFDADMEWDMGMPWYRPTRVSHVVNGSDFGWRSGSGKWASDYPDTLPSVVEIGPGSPTGIVFGTGAAFPEAYQRSLFLSDWTFGTMYAVTLEEQGGSFVSDGVEEFLSGVPLPLTDVVIGENGSMYFLTGGRGTQSRLYRVFYYGNRDTALGERSGTPHDATLRHKLEELQRPGLTRVELDAVWAQLSREDRIMRHAARVALELQPLETWASRIIEETNPDRVIQAAIAMARQGGDEHRAAAEERLHALDWDSLTDRQRVDQLRAAALLWTRGEGTDGAPRADWTAKLNDQFPSNNSRLNEELARCLVYLEAPGVIEKCLDLMGTASPAPATGSPPLLDRNESYGGPIRDAQRKPAPTRGLHYAFILRTVREGWTEQTRTRYITWLATARAAGGGASYQGFIDRMMQQSFDHCPEPLRAKLELHAKNIAARNAPRPEAYLPRGPWRVWTVEDSTRTVETQMKGRDFAMGAGLYQSAACANCHQFRGYGESQGPDLTTVASRFSTRDLLTALIDPSHDVSDQYAWSQVRLKDGGERYGRLAAEDETTITIATNAFDEAKREVIDRDRIESIEPSPNSPMPPGLINPMSEDELRNFVAYLLSGGDPNHEMFE